MSSSVKKLQWEDPITTENLSQSHDTYWAVKIDNHILKTSLKEDLLIPSRALAVAIAEEWDSQGETMDITTLHLYNMMTKAVAAQNNSDLLGHMKRECSRILENDEICYQEDPNSKNEFKKDLALQQIDKYGVLLDYLKQEFDVHLKVWTHVSIEQQDKSCKLIEPRLDALDPFVLNSIYQVALNSKSTALALAFIVGGKSLKQQIGLIKAVEIARVSEHFQQSREGLVEGSHDYDRLSTMTTFGAANSLISLAKLRDF